MSTIYIAIDPGKYGSIAVMEGNKIETYPMPLVKTELDYHELVKIIARSAKSDTNKVHVIFEKLGVIFGTSKATAFSMGEQCGAIEMACIANHIPYTKIRPIVWQKEMLQGVDEVTKSSISGKKQVRDTKAMALIAIKRIFPELKLTFGKVALKPHDGLIDAVLMAEYARRKNL